MNDSQPATTHPAQSDAALDGGDSTDFGRHAYLNLADELSAPETTIRDLDPMWVGAASEYARDHGLPWPISDIDLAIQYVEAMERGEGPESPADYAPAVEALDAATDAYERFQEALRELGHQMHRIDPWLWERFDAYPGWNGTRDVGAGQDMLGWLNEVGRRLGVVE